MKSVKEIQRNIYFRIRKNVRNNIEEPHWNKFLSQYIRKAITLALIHQFHNSKVAYTWNIRSQESLIWLSNPHILRYQNFNDFIPFIRYVIKRNQHQSKWTYYIFVESLHCFAVHLFCYFTFATTTATSGFASFPYLTSRF